MVTVSVVQQHSFPKRFMDAGSGVEPEAPEHETGMLPLHYPAELTFVSQPVAKQSRQGETRKNYVFPLRDFAIF